MHGVEARRVGQGAFSQRFRKYAACAQSPHDLVWGGLRAHTVVRKPGLAEDSDTGRLRFFLCSGADLRDRKDGEEKQGDKQGSDPLMHRAVYS